MYPTLLKGWLICGLFLPISSLTKHLTENKASVLSRIPSRLLGAIYLTLKTVSYLHVFNLLRFLEKIYRLSNNSCLKELVSALCVC